MYSLVSYNPCFPSAFICDTFPDLKLVTKGGIKPDLCSLSYAVVTVTKVGRGTMLAVLDLEYAYQIVPVHPDVRWLLGMEWGGELQLSWLQEVSYY